MLPLGDNRWQNLEGGYRIGFDPSHLLSKLQAINDTKAVWHELWEGLHHQGDVGEASYAAVPYLVRFYCEQGGDCWNTYAIVAVIELARGVGTNPEVPRWLEEDYFKAIRELAEIGAVDILRVRDPESIRAILSIVAIAVGCRTHARFLLKYSGEELLKIESEVAKADS